jgi:uncharacterized protein involved in outer membrane biogenesis
MKKILLALLVLFLTVILALCFFRNIIAKSALEKAVNMLTGLKMSVANVNVGVFRSVVEVKELKLYNPPDFDEKLMLDLPNVFLGYDLGAFLKNQIHLKVLKIYLKEAVVINSAEGKLNIQVFEKFQPKDKGQPKAEQKSAEFLIDFLSLKIDKVIYKDYFKRKSPQVLEFNVGIDEEYRNIDDPNVLVRLVTFKALMNTAIGRLANFDVDQFKIDTSKLVKDAGQTLDGVMEGAKGLDKTGKDILGTFNDSGKNLRKIFSEENNVKSR